MPRKSTQTQVPEQQLDIATHQPNSDIRIYEPSTTPDMNPGDVTEVRPEQQQAQPAAREPGDEPERQPLPPQRGWKHNNAAGVESLNYIDTEKKIYEFWLKFRDGKPSDAVRSYLKDNGFRWSPNAPSGGRWPEVTGAWVMPIGYQTTAQDRLRGERVFDKVVEMIAEEKGLVPEREPF